MCVYAHGEKNHVKGEIKGVSASTCYFSFDRDWCLACFYQSTEVYALNFTARKTDSASLSHYALDNLNIAMLIYL